MNISDEDTKELDSYGVWVKNSEDGDSNILDKEELDLPDFDDTDFSDMFKDDSQFTTADKSLDNDFSSDLDSTLSTDELANITAAIDVSIENIESPIDNENTNTNFSIDDISTEEFSLDDMSSGNHVTDDLSPESNSLNDFSMNENNTDEEDISLDDFMENGFSDDSVASGNNGFEPGFEPGGTNNPLGNEETEELSLDDFMDTDFSETNSDSQKEDEIEEEPPLEMDISFDDSADSVQSEDNISLDTDYSIEDEDDFEPDTEIQTTIEEVSIDSFVSENLGTDSTTLTSSSDINIDTEEIDLSDFGIDTSAEETPITQDMEESKNKDVIVDYDLSVGNENTTIAPIVSEVENDTNNIIEDILEEQEYETQNTTVVDNSLLQQIVADLSGLKEEINRLKTNIEEIKTTDHQEIQNTSRTNEQNEILIEESCTDGGFFGTDDGDDTIALSFDELDNIMNTADFNSTDSNNKENHLTEDTDNIVEGIFENNIEENTPSVEDNIEKNNDDIFASESDKELNSNLSFNFEDEKLEEPVIDDINLEDNEDTESDENDLPSEISIPTEEEMVVSNDSSDFMDSITNSNELPNDNLYEMENLDLPNEISEDDTLSIDENQTDDDLNISDFDNLSDESDNFTNNQTSCIIDEHNSVDEKFTNVDELTTNYDSSETIIENENISEETSILEDELATESYINDSFEEVDNLDNTLSNSNFEYLTSKDTSTQTSTVLNEDEKNTSIDLKQDIKSVLLYMDQLLENLPEDKIIEFAKSDEFVTYKKLFSELGLS